MTVDHNLAKEWATAEQQRTILEEALAKTRIELDNLKNKQERIVKDLRTGVGAQKPQRLYDIGDGQVVMVSVAGGVQLVQVEKGAKNG